MAKQMVNRSALKDEYKGYLADLGSSIKNKKSRVEIEREKQMNAMIEAKGDGDE
jgi:hypothetical protein